MRLLNGGSVPSLDKDKGLLFINKVNLIIIKQLIEIIPQLSEWIKHIVSRTFFTIINFSFYISMKFDLLTLSDHVVVYYHCYLTARTTVFKLKSFGFLFLTIMVKIYSRLIQLNLTAITVYAGIATE